MTPSYSPRKKDQHAKKRSPAWYRGVKAEARAALQRCRERDELWRKRRAEAKASLAVKS
jgi:hypothetical protein